VAKRNVSDWDVSVGLSPRLHGFKLYDVICGDEHAWDIGLCFDVNGGQSLHLSIQFYTPGLDVRVCFIGTVLQLHHDYLEGAHQTYHRLHYKIPKILRFTKVTLTVVFDTFSSVVTV
jgi:hypothetical protein